MSCERYRDWMTDAAAGDLQKNRRTELELHLNGCAGCRAEFQRVQILLNAIDFGVTAQTAAEPSLKLIESVRARIREESPVVAWWSAWNARWIPAAACAAVLILAASIWTLWPRNQAPRQLITSSVTPSIAQAGRTPLVSGAATPRITPERNEPLAAFLRPARKRNVRRIERRQEAPEIIVQPGQMRALELFVQVMNSRQVDGAKLLADLKATDRPIEVQPLEVKPLVIAPLESPKIAGDKSGEGGASDGDNRFIASGKSR